MSKILLVDDEPQLLKAMARLLARAAFEVETAGSGPEALATLQTFAPDLVLSDLRMPGMTGAALLKQVRIVAPDALRALMTGHADAESLLQAINEGVIHFYVDKPWKNETLITRLRAEIGKRAR